jgi:hypothetical protein
VIHLGAKHFLSHVCPAPSKFKKRDRSNLQADEDNYDDGDLLSKLIALVNQVRISISLLNTELNDLIMQIRASPQARAFLKECCENVGAPQIQLIQWIRTRWSSMFNMIDRMIELRAVRSLLPQLYYSLC